jgi:RNA polymerase I-specific transcription initiation factor RRN5
MNKNNQPNRNEDNEKGIIMEEDSLSSYQVSPEGYSTDENSLPSIPEDLPNLNQSGRDASSMSDDGPRSQGSRSLSTSKRRKIESHEAMRAEGKRLRSSYSNDYRRLLNADIQDAVLQRNGSILDPLAQSQIGLAIWTPSEKEIFFTALGRLGKDNAAGISARINSKSVPEVREYLLLLRQGMLENNLSKVQNHVPGLSEFPAAAEVGQECENMLELAADSLNYRQERYEEQVEEGKWGQLPWLLDLDAANWVEEQLEGEIEEQTLQKDLPSVELLNLRNFLELSSRIFMNPAGPREEENWRGLAEAGEEPSIRTTAFEDIRGLTISITKRLISATIFTAMSRLRSTDSRAFKARPVIRAVDVEAAARTIGLELNSDKFWIGCPRRCNLKVYRNSVEMDYNMLESFLRGKSNTNVSPMTHGDVKELDNSYPSDVSDSEMSILSRESLFGSDAEPDSESKYFDLMSRDAGSGYNSPMLSTENEFEIGETNFVQAMKRSKKKQEIDHAKHIYAEAFDTQASLMEERRLWLILGKNPPFTVDPEDVKLPDHPIAERKQGEELKDWRDNMEYWSEWETLDMLIRGENVAESLVKRAPQQDETADDATSAAGSVTEDEEREDMNIKHGYHKAEAGLEEDEDDESDAIEFGKSKRRADRRTPTDS